GHALRSAALRPVAPAAPGTIEPRSRWCRWRSALSVVVPQFPQPVIDLGDTVEPADGAGVWHERIVARSQWANDRLAVLDAELDDVALRESQSLAYLSRDRDLALAGHRRFVGCHALLLTVRISFL